MASFTDQIQQFNPYIQQLPVEEMKQVGMYKQQQYDQGVQKIQGYIDNIAGMDVANDVDKQHLQSKLNELGNNLKTVAAGDFSNHQLVNSVGGMATSIVKDPLIKNAVSSTAWLRKESAEMEKAIQSGKSSESNIYDFNEKASKYLNATRAGEVFRDRYTPYRDVKAKAMEAIKALHPNLQKYDVAEKIIDGIRTGKMAEVMQSYKIEGVTENQIKQALSATLDSNDYNQLNIDGKFRFRDVNPDQLVSHILDGVKTQKLEANEQISELKSQRALAISNPTKVAEIDDRLAYYSNLIGEIDINAAQDIENAKNNPDAVKGNMYKNAFIGQMANAFKWSHQEQEFKDSPFEKIYQWKQKFALDQQIEKRISANADRSYALETLKFNHTLSEDAKKAADLAPGIPQPIGNETTRNQEAVSMFNDHLNTVTSEMETSLNQMINQGYSDKQISNAIASYKDKGNKATDIPTSILGSVQAYLKNENYRNSLQTKSDELRKQADNEVGLNTISDDFLKTKTNITMPGGLKLTPKEILGIRQAENITIVGNVPIREVNEAGLNANQKAFVKQMQGLRYGARYKKDIESTLNKSVSDVMIGYEEATNKYRSILEKANDLYIQKLAPITTTFVPTLQVVPFDKDGGMPTKVSGILAQLAKSGNLEKIAADGNTNMEDTNKLLLDANNKNTKVFVKASGDKYEIWLTDLKGSVKDQKFKVEPAQVENMFGSSFMNRNSRDAIRLELGRGNTNLQSDPTKSILQTQFGDFPNISKMQITADLQRDASSPDLFIPTINIRKKNGGYQPFEISGENKLRRVGYAQGEQQLKDLNDNKLLEIIKLSYPNFDFSTLDIK